MDKLEDYYGSPIRSGFYKTFHNFDNICYLDLENLKIIRMDNKEIEMNFSSCKHFIPIQNPLKLAEHSRKVADFITSKLENLIQNNKANLSADSSSKSIINMEKYSENERKYLFNESNVRTDGMAE